MLILSYVSTNKINRTEREENKKEDLRSRLPATYGDLARYMSEKDKFRELIGPSFKDLLGDPMPRTSNMFPLVVAIHIILLAVIIIIVNNFILK